MAAFALYDGHVIDPLNIKPEDITLERIAHHLSNIMRFGGSLPIDVTYTVAEHSLNLARHMQLQPSKRYAILHDASEAFLGDIVTGLKAGLRDYRELENRVMTTILEKYEVDVVSGIHLADKKILLDEVEAVMPQNYDIYAKACGPERLHAEISFDGDRRVVKHQFLDYCHMLGLRD